MKIKIIILALIILFCAGCQKENFSEMTPVAENEKPYIEEIIQYTKDVNVLKDSQYTVAPHRVFIPKIVDDGEAVQKINDEMFVLGEKYVDLLEKNQEDDTIINISYNYTEQNGIFGIIIDSKTGKLSSGRVSTYDFYYYDSENNRVLTEEEYYSLLENAKDEIWERVKSSPEFIMNHEFYVGAYLDRAIFCDDLIFALVKTTDGYSKLTIQR